MLIEFEIKFINICFIFLNNLSGNIGRVFLLKSQAGLMSSSRVLLVKHLHWVAVFKGKSMLAFRETVFKSQMFIFIQIVLVFWFNGHGLLILYFLTLDLVHFKKANSYFLLGIIYILFTFKISILAIVIIKFILLVILITAFFTPTILLCLGWCDIRTR